MQSKVNIDMTYSNKPSKMHTTIISKKYILFGSGKRAERILRSAKEFELAYVIDSDSNKWGKTIILNGNPYTISPPDLLKSLPLGKFEVIIGSNYTDEMIESIKAIAGNTDCLVKSVLIYDDKGYYKLFFIYFGESTNLSHSFLFNEDALVFYLGKQPCSIRIKTVAINGESSTDRSILKTNGDCTDDGIIEFPSRNPNVYFENVIGFKSINIEFEFTETNYKKAYEFANNYIDQLYDFSCDINPEFVPEEDLEPIVFSENDVKPIAYYLPQFHQIPENNEWWEKGFTEWTNVTKAYPLFEGHYQPHLPIDMGFYDLSNIDVQKRQIELAKKYGVYGFCYYYYHYNDGKILEMPIEQHLKNKDLDFPFCLLWETCSWTKRWIGDKEILKSISNNDAYYLGVIEDIFKYAIDDRYIRVNGKPLIIIYRIGELDGGRRFVELIRNYFREKNMGEIFLLHTINDADRQWDMANDYYDGLVEFYPNGIRSRSLSHKYKSNMSNSKTTVYNYSDLVNAELYKDLDRVFCNAVPNWDNTPRYKNSGTIYHGSTPELYGQWLKKIIKHTNENYVNRDKYIFINAWNEWAESAHLEPDRKFGYAYLKATREAVTEE